VEIGVGIAVHAVRDFARDFLAGEELGGTIEEVGERERVVHHETLHSGLLLYDGTPLIFNPSATSFVNYFLGFVNPGMDRVIVNTAAPVGRRSLWKGGYGL
jgi:hypothetical protein